MGADYIKALVKEEKVEYPSVPPGFDSLTSFTLKKINASEVMASEVDSGSQKIPMGTEGDIGDAAELKESLRRSRPWINFSEFNGSPEESEPEQFIENLIPRSLPKGVLRGCSECSNCQKVVAKWHPEDACRPVLGDAPVFHPTEEEFKDALKYIATIRPRAEKYGICRIVPPPSWNPPCPQKEKSIWENLKFPTRVQEIDKLQNRESTMKMSRIHESSKRKKRKYQETGMGCTIGNGDVTKANDHEYNNETKPFGFEPGSIFTLEAFQKYADDFKSHYFGMDSNIVIEGDHSSFQKQWEPSVENIEGEYWRIIEKPTEEIEVIYGADLDTGVFGSGFPKVSSSVNSDYEEKYLKSEWNLNIFSRLPTSVLSFEKSDIPGVLAPWLYVGMCFSSFCWHVEDHYLYSLNYMHWGAPKMWYGVPGGDAQKLEEAMKKHLPDLFKEQPDLLHKLVTQLSPSTLTSESVPVYRCVQNPKEFVLTFPRAYHSGFSCGFNCAEAVNVAPLDWLPYGQHAVELYREQSRKTTISHDKLLFGVAKEMVRAQWELQLLRKNTLDNLRWTEVCGREGVLANALKRRVEMETTRRQYLCSSYSAKMDNSFDAASERECVVCLYDLHLSAVGCRCCPERFACLYHARQLCTCALSEKTFLFRYEMDDLNLLVKALEGTLSAIYRWAKLDLGLALSPLVSKDKSQSPGPDIKPFNILERTKQEGRLLDVVTSTSIDPICQELRVPELLKEPTTPTTGKLCTEPQQGKSIKKESMGSSSVLKEIPLNKSVGRDTHANKSLASGNNNIILLSDDEDGDPVKRSLGKATGDSSKLMKLSGRLDNYDDKVSPCSYTKEQALNSHQTNMSVMGERNISMKPEVRKADHSSHPAHLKLDHGKGYKLMNSSMLSSDYKVQPFPQNSSCNLGTGSIKNISSKGDNGFLKSANAGNSPLHPQTYGSRKTNNEPKDEKTGLHSNLTDKAQSNIGSSSRAVKAVYKKFLQKGPWVGNAVCRTNCIVEPLEFGVVCSGKLWSTCLAIYPKGFKTRVSYLSVLDPGKCCYYVSEILDAGLCRPLFMVKVETCPSEVFIHFSVTKCWDMVKDRVNEEILKQVRLGRLDLPSFQRKGSVYGFEMFGFSSPEIIKGIEALDPNRVCTEYWKSRAQTSELHHSLHNNFMKPVDDQASNPPDKLVLKGFFRKANTEELHSLHNVLSGDQATVDRGLVTRLLDEEIQGRAI